VINFIYVIFISLAFVSCFSPKEGSQHSEEEALPLETEGDNKGSFSIASNFQDHQSTGSRLHIRLRNGHEQAETYIVPPAEFGIVQTTNSLKGLVPYTQILYVAHTCIKKHIRIHTYFIQKRLLP